MANEQYEHDEGVKSTAAIAGHPIHPMLVALPIGFLVGALLSDIAFARNEDEFWALASLWLIRAGFVTGALAAVFGLIDFLTIQRARRLDGWIHFIGNAIGLLLTLANWLVRQGDPVGGVMPTGLALSVIVVLLLGVTGWFGGELAFRYKIGVIGRDNETQQTLSDSRKSIRT
jgi:uncharacterized membrane protein